MNARQREWMKSIAAFALVLAYFLWAAGWMFTLGFAVLCAAIWYFGHQRPIARMVKQAKRRTQ